LDSGGGSSASPSQHLAALHGSNDHPNEESQYKGIEHRTPSAEFPQLENASDNPHRHRYLEEDERYPERAGEGIGETGRPADEREAAAWTALGEVIDPELGLPITDLGLIYRVDVVGGTVEVDMTTTTPVCPLTTYLTQMAESKLLALDDIDDIILNTVHEPRWTPEMMSAHARTILGVST
jgi:metal-sulfur cluster biosynthetic enzyme